MSTTEETEEVTRYAKDLKSGDRIILTINRRDRYGIVSRFEDIPIDPKTGQPKEGENAKLHWRTPNRPNPRIHEVRPDTPILLDPKFLPDADADADADAGEES